MALFLGEGVFGLGIYWPIFLLLVDWDYIYWFGLVCGIFISLLTDIRLGLPSLFLVVVFGLVSLLVGVKRSSQWALVILGVFLNFVFDKLFGLNWSLGEMLLVLGIGFLIVRDLDKQETIKINF